MPAAICKLGDVTVTAAGPIAWAVTTGTAPFTAEYIVHDKSWKRVLGMLGQETTLTITDWQGKVTKIRGVFPLHETPTNEPFTHGILVADRRWRWSRKLTVRDFNVARKTGNRVLLGGAPVEISASVDTFRFLKHTLREGTARWSSRFLIEDVLETVDPGAWVIDALSVQADGKTGAMSIQNLLLRDGGDAAIGRALADVPGTAIKVEEDGRAHVFDATDVMAAQAILEKAGQPTELGDIARKIDYAAVRPSMVYVYFAREVELRFDFDESVTRRTDANEMYCENVLPLPDPTTRMTDGRVLAQGTWVTVAEALDAWEANKTGTEAAPYSFSVLRTHYLNGNLLSMWAGAPSDPNTSGDATARVHTIMRHYRTTFRINRTYVDRLRDLRNVRVSILDTNTGARVPALTWSQYCLHAADKGTVYAQRHGAKNAWEYVNADKYPGANAECDSKVASQAIVTVRDPDLGIISLDYVDARGGFSNGTIPCLIGDSNGNVVPPTRDLSEQDTAAFSIGGKVGAAGAYVALASTYQMAVIVSGTVAAPNNARMLHRETVNPSDLDPYLASHFTAKSAQGPAQHVFVPPQQSTARFGWQTTETARATTFNLLGLNSPDPKASGVPEGTRDLGGFLWVNKDEVEEVAKGKAAEVYAGYVDAPEGRHVTHGRSVHMNGNIGSVTHSLTPDGRVMTAVDFSPARPSVSAFAYLSDPVRQIVLRVIKADPAA